MATKWLKYSYHLAIFIAVAYNTWCILKLNAAVNAIAEFILAGLKIGN